MENSSILVVDDEKNIRLTLSQALSPLGIPVRTAVNGEDALTKLDREPAGLILLDLKMPGMDGIVVLRLVRERWPKTRVIIITAHGTVASAVTAMKLGAADFIQKPFSPPEIRDLVTQVLDRESLSEETAGDYLALVSLAKRHVTDGRFDEAQRIIRRAVAEDPGQPEAYNLLGVLLEIEGKRLEGLKFYRAALDIDPTFRPASANLERATSWDKYGPMALGPESGTEGDDCGEEDAHAR